MKLFMNLFSFNDQIDKQSDEDAEKKTMFQLNNQ